MNNPLSPLTKQQYIAQLRNTPPPLAIEPIASEGNPEWAGPYEKAPLPIYPNQSDLESDK